MSEPFGVHDFGTAPVQQTSLGGVEGNGSQAQLAAQDTLQASDEVAALAYLYSSSNPVLVAPNQANALSIKALVTTGATAEMVSSLFHSMDAIHDQLIVDILDSWSEQIAEQVQRTKEWLRSPQYQEFLELRFPETTERERGQYQDRIQFGLSLTQHAGVNALAVFESSSDGAVRTGGLVLLAGSLAIGMGMMTEFVPIQNGLGVEALNLQPTIVHDALPIIGELFTDPALAAQLGFIAGMIASGALYANVLPLFIDAEAKGGKLDLPQLANNFAGHILSVVSDENFRQHVLHRLIDTMPNSEKLPEGVKHQMAAVVNVVLLATALAALYQNETGWLGEEVNHLLEGNLSGFFDVEGKEGELRQGLGAALQAAFAELSPERQERLREALGNYFKEQPSLKQLSRFEQVFEAVAHNLQHDEIAG